MSTVPANSSFEFISPLALRLSQFLALKHAMGYRYREEGRALRRASTVPPGKIMLAVLLLRISLAIPIRNILRTA